MLRRLAPALLLVLALTGRSTAASARAYCADPDLCGGRELDRERIIEPPPPHDPGPPVPRGALRFSQLRPRLRAIAPHVEECFATHFEGERPPRAVAVTVFVHPSGRWSLAFGPRPRRPAVDAEARGTTPLEVCIADWVSGEIGPRLEPFRGRAPRRVTQSYRVTLPAQPPSATAEQDADR